MSLFDSLQSYLAVILGVAGGILLALWLAVLVWVWRDIRARSRSGWAAVLSLLLVAVLPVIGLVIYLLLRPRRTLLDAYDRSLEQEALLQQIEDKPVCPSCSRPTRESWFFCPACHTHLRQPCPVCNSPLEMQWDICPWCGYLVDTADAAESVASAELEEAMPVPPEEEEQG